MVAGCGNKFVKFLFFTFNLLFCLIGAIVCGLAVWLRLDNEFQDIVSRMASEAEITMIDLEHTYIVLYIIMGLSGFMFITGFLGCCGAWCESLCVLGVFFSVVLTLFIVQIAGAVYVYFEQETFHERASDWYQQIIDKKADAKIGTNVVELIDEINKKFNCCDAYGCDSPKAVSPSASCKCLEDPKRTGCPYQVIQKVEKHWKIAAVVMGSILLIELLAMIFACCLCSGVRSTDYDYYYY